MKVSVPLCTVHAIQPQIWNSNVDSMLTACEEDDEIGTNASCIDQCMHCERLQNSRQQRAVFRSGTKFSSHCNDGDFKIRCF